MTASHFPHPVAAFRGRVTCHRNPNAVTLTGAAADSEDESLILTFLGPAPRDLPDSLAAPKVVAVDEHRYRLIVPSQAWEVEATRVHVHRDIGNAFYRAIPPRPAPLKKRLFWRAVLALAGSRAGKRLLLALRSR